MGFEGDLVFGAFRLDPAGRQVWRGTTAVPLRPKLFAALQYLVEHPGRLVTREELLRAVWSRTHVDETLLRGTMRDLRAALDDDAEAPRFIETIPHQGYRFLADVRREATTREPGAAPRAGEAPPHGLIERDRERTQLDRCLDRALDRKRQIVFVTGEPGIGKTALVDAFLEGLPNRHGVLVGRGQCVEQYGGSEAYLPVLEAIGQLCRHRAGKRVLGILNQYAPTWLAQLPALLTDGELDALQRKTQGAGRDRMLREMAEALEALSVEMPVALVFEDLHWSDHSTLDLLGVLARRREAARLLVVGTYRPADLIVSGHPLRALKQELHSRGLCEEVPLGFLSEPAIGAYLADRFGAAPEDTGFRSLAQLINRRTDGNPLFMVNIADDLVARGVIAIREGAWRVQVDREQMGAGVPDGLKPLIDRQLERLPAEDQRLLEAASVAGRVFSSATMAAALEATPDSVDERCEELVRRGVFIEEAPGLASGQHRFLHDLYLQALYERLSASRRARLHRRIAEFEVQAPADAVRERAAQLAVHFERGGDPATAVGHLQQAASNALKRQAFQEAIDLSRHALAILASLPPSSTRDEAELAVQMLLTTTFLMTKGYGAPEVAAAMARARELIEPLPPSPALLPALFGLARFRYFRGQLDEALALGKQCEALARQAPDPLLLISDSMMVYLHSNRGDFLLAREYGQRVVDAYRVERHGALALSHGDDPSVMAQGYAAGALWFLGYPEQSREMVAHSLELARRLGMPYAECTGLALATWVLLFARNVTGAAETLTAMETRANHHGFSFIRAQGTALRGWLLAEQGRDLATAIELLEGGLAGQALAGVVLSRPWQQAILAAALAAHGRAERAQDVITEALSGCDRSGELLDRMQVLIVKGDLAAAASEDGEAVACFQEAIAIAQRQAGKSFELRAATRLARLRQRQGKVAEARALLGDVYDWFTEGFDTPDLRDARALLDSLDAPAPRAKPKAKRIGR